MPRTVEQNQVVRRESRARIVAAALRLFSSLGYERTSVKLIAEEAGVAQGLMYRYFSGKEALLQAIFAQSIEDVQESFALAAAGDPAQPPVERIIRAAFALVQQRRDFWRLSYGVRMQASVLQALGGALPDWTTAIRETLEQALRESGVADPAVEAALLFASIDGVAQHYVLDADRYPLQAITEALVARYKGADDGQLVG